MSFLHLQVFAQRYMGLLLSCCHGKSILYFLNCRIFFFGLPKGILGEAFESLELHDRDLLSLCDEVARDAEDGRERSCDHTTTWNGGNSGVPAGAFDDLLNEFSHVIGGVADDPVVDHHDVLVLGQGRERRHHGQYKKNESHGKPPFLGVTSGIPNLSELRLATGNCARYSSFCQHYLSMCLFKQSVNK
tara:strand:- start:4847 stop:5413 length:567 start_codon:yes stop_codon:yes gene_type:complete